MYTLPHILAVTSDWLGVLREFWPVAAVAFIVSLVFTPLCRRFALKRKIVDKPDDFLKPHGRPIPYLGGVAIYLGWVAGLALATSEMDVNTRRIGGIALLGTIIMLIGLFDDLSVMSSRAKLAANILVAFGVLALGIGGTVIAVITNPLTIPKTDPIDYWLMWLYSAPLVLFIVVGATNATNLIDGMDGLCSGVLGIIAVGFFFLAAHLRTSMDPTLAHERLILAAAMLGGAFGFLPFNRNPAKIFMGDAGSMLLGLNAAIIILLFGEERLFRWMLGALLVFGLPIADMLLTLVRRFRNGRPLMEGDRSHFYDQLHDRGWSVRKVVVISYLLTIFFVLAGMSSILVRTRYMMLVVMAVVLVVVALVWKFDMVGIERDRHGQPARGAGANA